MKVENKEHLLQLLDNVNQRIEILYEQDMKECPDMEDYQFVKGELNKLMELDPTIEFPYWIRLHTTAEDLISQIRTLYRNPTREWEKYKKRKDYIDGVQNFFGSTTTKPKPKPNFGDDIYFGILRCVKIFCTKVSSFFGK